MVDVLGRVVARRPLAILAVWLVLAVALGLAAPDPQTVQQREPASLLKPDEPFNQAQDLAREAFPRTSARTRTTLVFARDGGLTDADKHHINRVALRLERKSEQKWRVLAPATSPFLRSRLVSHDGEAMLIVLLHEANYLSRRSVNAVEQAEALARADIPDGLQFAVTGEGGLGRDITRATERAYHRTTWVTVTAVLVILAFVYRAPLAACVPLLAIGLSVNVALQILAQLAAAGLAVSDLERTFLVVLMFGSGTDFGLFWIARYREHYHRMDLAKATAAATRGTASAILASAGTTIVGLSTLLSADLIPTRNAGRTLVIALAVALVAALTLIPALARLMGSRLFWPRHTKSRAEQPFVWQRIAHFVAGRPATVLLLAALLLAYPAYRGARAEYRYDAFGVIPPGSESAQGMETAQAHFRADQLFSWVILLEVPEDHDRSLDQLAVELAEQCRGVPGVTDVWGLDAPLGGTPTAASVTRAIARPWYRSDEPPSVRAEVMQPHPPLSGDAMALYRRLMTHLDSWAAADLPPAATLHATGLTSYIVNVKHVADADQRRVMMLLAIVITAIVLLWLRRPLLTFCMVGATLVLYLVAIGLTDAVFVHLLDGKPLDWKVRLFLFVVMVAVGQDYNIFLVSRILQERAASAPREAARLGIISTGRVISSCGLIMAATLGSIAATGLTFYQQLGLAFAIGILLDTFVVRPMVVPACYLVGLRLRGKSLDAEPAEP